MGTVVLWEDGCLECSSMLLRLQFAGPLTKPPKPSSKTKTWVKAVAMWLRQIWQIGYTFLSLLYDWYRRAKLQESGELFWQLMISPRQKRRGCTPGAIYLVFFPSVIILIIWNNLVDVVFRVIYSIVLDIHIFRIFYCTWAVFTRSEHTHKSL